MSEKYPIHEGSHETPSSKELHEHQEKLREHHEKGTDNSVEKSVHEQESARHEIHEQAISGNEFHKPQSEKRQHTPVLNTKEDKLRSFNTTMHHVRNELPPSQKVLSKIVHQPTIEKVSELAGKTVARPSGIAGATIAAFIGLLLVYGVAKFAGFKLSGSELPILLLIGFVAGLLLEWAYKSINAILGKSS